MTINKIRTKKRIAIKVLSINERKRVRPYFTELRSLTHCSRSAPAVYRSELLVVYNEYLRNVRSPRVHIRQNPDASAPPEPIPRRGEAADFE
jgi:hypothetical protein